MEFVIPNHYFAPGKFLLHAAWLVLKSCWILFWSGLISYALIDFSTEDSDYISFTNEF